MATIRKPKPDDIFEQASEMIEAGKRRNAMYDRLSDLYDQTRIDNGAEEDDEGNVVLVQMPYATNTIDLITDLASQMELVVEIPAAKETQQAKRDADEAEAWMRAWLSANERISQRNNTADAAWYGSMRSLVVMRTIFFDSLVKEGDEGFKVATVPCLLQVRDPRYTYFVEGAEGLDVVVEAWKRKAGEIRRKYPGVLRDESIDDADEIQWVEYWDKTYRCYFADGNPVNHKGLGTVIPHGYGCLPYAFGIARATPRADPERRFRPILGAVENLLRNIDIWFSILTTAGHDSVTNAWAVFSEDYGAAGTKQLDLSPDAINYFGPNDKVTPMQRASLPADFFQLGSQLMSAFQQATFPFAVYGQVEGSQVAGYTVNLLQQSGRRPLIPIWDAIERAYEGAIRNCVTICREKVAPLVGDEVPLMVLLAGGEDMAGKRVRRALKLDTRKFGDDFDVFCHLSDPMPQDEAANLRMALEATSGKLMSRETARRKYKLVSDSVAEEDRIAAESIYAQLMPLEGVKLAVERGYLPSTLKLPAGYKFVNGQVLPESLLEPPQRPQAPPTDMPSPQGAEVMPESAEVMGGPNPAVMQALAPRTVPVSLAEMSGAAPPPPAALPAPQPEGVWMGEEAY